MSIKNDLYTVLNDFGKENLQIEFQCNINSSVPKIKEILSKTIAMRDEKKDKQMNNNYNYNDSEKPLSLLCEAFLHYLLTTTSLPSQRKIMLKDVEIDLVIPDLKSLYKDPTKGLIIKFDKDSKTFDYINRLQNNIPIYKENIWLVSSTPLYINYRNYVIYKNQKDEESHTLFINENNMDVNSRYFNQNNEVNNNKSNIQNVNSKVIPFFKIIVDINKFLKDTKHTGFKFVP